MAGILLTQDGATIYAGTAASPTIQSTAITGLQCSYSIATATPAAFAWALAVPPGSGAVLSTDDAASGTFTPDTAGLYLLSCLGDATRYVLPLLISKVATTVYTGPISPPYLAPSQVATPTLGVVLFCDSTNSGALSYKGPDGLIKTISHS